MGKTYQSISVDAPIDKVWPLFRDFHDMSWASSVVESCEAVGDKKGDEIGAKRTLNGVFHETLIKLDDEEHVIEYSIDDGPGPVAKDLVSDYIGRVQLHPITEEGRTLVVWSSSWQAADNAAEEFCHRIYVALFADLKKTFA